MSEPARKIEDEQEHIGYKSPLEQARADWGEASVISNYEVGSADRQERDSLSKKEPRISGVSESQSSVQQKEKDEVFAASGVGADSMNYTGENIEKSRASRALGILTKRKSVAALLGGGGLTGVIVAGFMAAQPFQIVHFAQILGNFGFGPGNSQSSDRLTAGYRYLKYPNSPEMRRLGYLGNKRAAKVEAAWKKKGLTPEYSSSGRLTKLIVDPAHLPALRSAGLGPEINPRNGVHEIDIDPRGSGIGTKAPREKIKLVNNVVRTLDIKVGAIASRNLIKKAGVSFANLKTRRTVEETSVKLKKYVDKKKQQILEGRVTGSEVKTSEHSTDADGNQQVETESVASDGTRSAARQQVNDAAKKAGKGLAIVGITCAAYYTLDQADTLRKANVIIPLMRSAVRFISIGSQVQNNTIDIDELGFVTKELYDASAEDGKKSWTSSREIQAITGQDQTGQPIPPEADPTNSNSKILELFNSIPDFISGGISAVCGVVSSSVGAAASYVVDFLSGGAVGVVAGEIQSRLSAEVVEEIAARISGDMISTDPKGAMAGSYGGTGSLLAGNENELSMAGRELSETEARDVYRAHEEDEKLALQQEGLLKRLFSPYNYRSVTGVAIIKTPHSTDALSATKNVLRSAWKIPLFTTKQVANSATPPTLAAGSGIEASVFNIQRVGFSLDELNDKRYENPFENAEIIGPRLDSYSDRIEKCFGLNLESDGRLTVIDDAVRILSKDREGANCNDTNEEFTRVRFYIRDTMVQEAASCYEGDAESCGILAFSSSDTASLPTTGVADGGQDTSALTCPTGTEDGGVHQDYSPGKVPTVKVRVCGIPSAIPSERGVNASIASNALLMITAMREAGLNPTGTAFRSYERQEELYNQNCRGGSCSPPTAKPGTSMHEVGIAIDFSNMCHPNSTCRPGVNDQYDWLVENAAKYGFKKLEREAWHWSANGR